MMRKLFASIMVIMTAAGCVLLLAAPEEPVFAKTETGVAADTLTVRVGYQGYEYEDKKIYTIDSLMALPNVTQIYTWIDELPIPCINPAKGIRLTDILRDAGIDRNSVSRVYFWCTDVKDNWYEDRPAAYLFDTTRYYYPHLAENWDTNANAALIGAEEDKKQVDTIIAAEDAWARISTENEPPGFGDMNGNTRFRLVFGMTDTKTPTAYQSAKWIHRIDVLLGGTPPKEEEPKEEEQDDPSESSNQEENAGDDSLVGSEKGPNNEEKPANEDPPKDGNDSGGKDEGTGDALKKEGDVLKDEDDVLKNEEDDEEDGRESATDDDNGENNRDANHQDEETEVAEAATSAETTPPAITTRPAVSVVALTVGEDSGKGGRQPWRIRKMGFGAEPLKAPKPDDRLVQPALGAMTGCFLFGGCVEFIRYRREYRKK
jgi:hypothetical protein